MRAMKLGRFAAALCLCVPFVAAAGPYDAIYVFGDSLSDGGSDLALSSFIHSVNPAFPVTPGAPADFAGRFGNGPVAVDYLAADLGLPLTAHYLTPPFAGGATGGTNYAQGGATSGLENASLPGNIGPLVTGFKGVLAEVNDYHASTPVADPNAVYVVWGAANDFIHPNATAISPACAAAAIPAVCQAVTNIAASVATLAAMGAHHILVPNLPDLGLTPSAITAGLATVAGAHAVSVAYDAALASALQNLSLSFPGDVIPFDVFSLFNTILANAGAEGFTDTTDMCLTGSSANASSVISAPCLAAGPNSYVFWDDIHPTTHTQALLSQAFAAALGVPEPSTVALLGLGLFAIVAGRRVRRR
jgi:phospholipase/lecithinase/hemolysin